MDGNDEGEDYDVSRPPVRGGKVYDVEQEEAKKAFLEAAGEDDD